MYKFLIKIYQFIASLFYEMQVFLYQEKDWNIRIWNIVDFVVKWERLKEVRDWNMEYLLVYKWGIIDMPQNIHI